MDIVADREKRRIYLADIVYLETLGRRLLIHMKDEELETYLSVKSFMDEFGKSDFLQISRYVAVSISRIQRIVGRNLYLRDGRELLISIFQLQRNCILNICVSRKLRIYKK